MHCIQTLTTLLLIPRAQLHVGVVCCSRLLCCCCAAGAGSCGEGRSEGQPEGQQEAAGGSTESTLLTRWTCSARPDASSICIPQRLAAVPLSIGLPGWLVVIERAVDGHLVSTL